MGATRYCLSFIYYEQLKLPFLPSLTEGVAFKTIKIVDTVYQFGCKLQIISREKHEYNGTPQHKNSFLKRN